MKITETKENGVTVIRIDPGNTVLCDLCNEDYTEDDETTGGLLFAGKAVCPLCEKRVRELIVKHNEQRYIKAEAKLKESFRDFV